MRPPNPPLLQITRFDSCESTNERLLRAAENGAPAGSVYVAREQTAGRGRRGRRWLAEPGCTLAFSLLWTFPLQPSAPHALSGLSLAVGVAILRALNRSALGQRRPDLRLGLKWPNDILLRDSEGRDAKVGGILIESILRQTPHDAREMAVVIGVGLNCLASAALATAVAGQPVAALADAYSCNEADLAPDVLLPVVLDSLQQMLDEFSLTGFATLRDEWLAANLWQNEPVQISEADRVLLEGQLCGVDSDGALCVDTPTGIRRVIAGDVSLRKV